MWTFWLDLLDCLLPTPLPLQVPFPALGGCFFVSLLSINFLCSRHSTLCCLCCFCFLLASSLTFFRLSVPLFVLFFSTLYHFPIVCLHFCPSSLMSCLCHAHFVAISGPAVRSATDAVPLIWELSVLRFGRVWGALSRKFSWNHQNCPNNQRS